MLGFHLIDDVEVFCGLLFVFCYRVLKKMHCRGGGDELGYCLDMSSRISILLVALRWFIALGLAFGEVLVGARVGSSDSVC